MKDLLLKDNDSFQTVDKPSILISITEETLPYSNSNLASQSVLSQGHLIGYLKLSLGPWSTTMEKFPLLDIVIGLSLIYAFLSLLSSEITEFAVKLLRWRTRSLKRAIITSLGESLELNQDSSSCKDTIAGRLYSDSRMNQIVQYFGQRYVSTMLYDASPQLFAEILLDVLQNLLNSANPAEQRAASEITIAKLLWIAESSPEISPQLRANLKRLIDRTQRVEPDPDRQMTQLKHQIAQWFSQAMSGAVTVYNYNLKAGTFLMSLSLAIVVNADSLYMIRSISETTAKRAIIVQNATGIAGCRDNLSSIDCVERMAFLMESSTLPIGWHRVNRKKQFSQLSGGNLMRAIGGWLLTAIAISMGSRFWFQILRGLTLSHNKPGVSFSPRDNDQSGCDSSHRGGLPSL